MGRDDTTDPTQLIYDGEPPLDIRKFFPSFKDAVRFYAGVRARQFGIGTASDHCCECQQAAGAVVAEFQWSALFSRFSMSALHILLLFVGHLRIPIKTESVVFSSFHGFCQPCWKRIRRRRVMRGVLEACSLVLILAGAGAALGCGCALLFTDHLQTGDKTELGLGCGGGVVALLLAVAIRIQSRLLGSPASLRAIAPRPFQLSKTILMQVITVPGTGQTVHVPRYRPATPGGLSWQQTGGILIGVFGVLPASIFSFGTDIDPTARRNGMYAFCACIVSILVLTAWHVRRQKKVREIYYRQTAAQLAANQKNL